MRFFFAWERKNRSCHLPNALKPSISFSSAAIQALGACGAGFFYGAFYYRTGKNLFLL